MARLHPAPIGFLERATIDDKVKIVKAQVTQAIRLLCN
jgi:hypothetical protein